MALWVLLTACSTTYQNKDVVGDSFPSVSGNSLSGQAYSMPQDFAGEKTILLIGYVQNAQFDIDRWLIGLDMKGVTKKVYELPTIAGMFPQFFSTQIDQGMRQGIPKSLWGGVITIYDDGETVQQWTGNTNPNNARVVVLDENGKVIYFYDQGFAVTPLNELLAIVNA
ncbi:MAG: hypothetical protein HWE13_07775 [Gammaproteobacteria bacterium]|nr:hypothetical protein [Gammaproteobacteria bacterium]NVK88009.1 hypothetical protein [Gammaproteobacteria bacterium]